MLVFYQISIPHRTLLNLGLDGVVWNVHPYSLILLHTLYITNVRFPIQFQNSILSPRHSAVMYKHPKGRKGLPNAVVGLEGWETHEKCQAWLMYCSKYLHGDECDTTARRFSSGFTWNRRLTLDFVCILWPFKRQCGLNGKKAVWENYYYFSNSYSNVLSFFYTIIWIILKGH